MLEVRDPDQKTQTSAFLEEQLLADLWRTNTQALNSDLFLISQDEGGGIKGGLTASTAFGWLNIKVLWVPVQHRSQGIGRNLMERASQIGQERGCHGIWLDTSNEASLSFNKALGFAEFGLLENQGDELPSRHK